MKTTSLTMALAALLAMTAGCATNGDDAASGSEDEIIGGRRIAVGLTGYVMGELASSEASATDSVRKQCDAWVARLNQLSGAERVETTSCGTFENQDRYGRFQFVAKPTATVVVRVQGWNAPTAASDVAAWTVRGDLSSSSFAALNSYNDRCTAALEETKRIYGARFIAGSCDAPTNQDKYGRSDFQGLVRAFVLPRSGTPTTGTSFVQGDLSSSASTALASWSEQCKTLQTNLAGGNPALFGELRCGEPKNIDKYGRFQFTSEPTFSFVTERGAALRSAETTIKGDLSSSGFTAYQSWSTKCFAEQAAAKAQYGQRFVYASCGVPTNTDAYGRVQYASSFAALIKPL